MFIEVLTPEETIYIGDVKGIQLPGIDGYFELLDNHAPMVAALGKGQMKIMKKDTPDKIFTVDGGFVQTADNKTAVLIESIVR